jgi:Ni/Co efflux regulator RcnB
MKRTVLAALACALAATSAPMAFAQPDHGQQQGQFKQHDEWRKGAQIQKEDWGRGQPVDYHAHHLRKPPRGHEWRQVDGNYVLAAAATGVIASVIAHPHR